MEIESLISITETVFENQSFLAVLLANFWLFDREFLMVEFDRFGINAAITYILWSLKCWNYFESKIPVHQKLEWLFCESWSGSF